MTSLRAMTDLKLDQALCLKRSSYWSSILNYLDPFRLPLRSFWKLPLGFVASANLKLPKWFSRLRWFWRVSVQLEEPEEEQARWILLKHLPSIVQFPWKVYPPQRHRATYRWCHIRSLSKRWEILYAPNLRVLVWLLCDTYAGELLLAKAFKIVFRCFSKFLGASFLKSSYNRKWPYDGIIMFNSLCLIPLFL